VDEEVPPDRRALGLRPCPIEREDHERPPGPDVVAADEELKPPRRRLEHVGLVGRPGAVELVGSLSVALCLHDVDRFRHIADERLGTVLAHMHTSVATHAERPSATAS